MGHILRCTSLLLITLCAVQLADGAKNSKKLERKPLIEKLVKGVDGPNEKGQYHIEHEGKKWAVLESKEEDGAPKIIFVSTKGFAISYDDPRTGKPIEVPEEDAAAGRAAAAAAPPPPPIKSQEDLAAGLPHDALMDEHKRWYIIDNEGKKHYAHKHEAHDRYYFATEDAKESSWTDPRRGQPPPQDEEEDPYEDPAEEGAAKDEL